MHLQITMSATAADLSEPNLVKMDTTTSMEEVNNNNNSFKENDAKQTTFANLDSSSVIAENNLGKCRHIFGFSQEAADTTLFFVKTCAQGVSLIIPNVFRGSRFFEKCKYPFYFQHKVQTYLFSKKRQFHYEISLNEHKKGFC